jgi:hypothetical protein
MQHAIPTRRHRSALEGSQRLANFRKSGLSQVQFVRQGHCLSSLAVFETFQQSAERRCPGFHRAPQPEARLPGGLCRSRTRQPTSVPHGSVATPSACFSAGRLIPRGSRKRDGSGNSNRLLPARGGLSLAPRSKHTLPMIATSPATRVFVALQPIACAKAATAPTDSSPAASARIPVQAIFMYSPTPSAPASKPLSGTAPDCGCAQNDLRGAASGPPPGSPRGTPPMCE